MEPSRFDVLVRALGARASRRGAAASLAAVIAGVAVADGEPAGARPRPRCRCRRGYVCDSRNRCVCRSGVTCARTCCAAGAQCCGGACAVPVWKAATAFGAPGPESKGLDLPNGIVVSSDGLTAWVCETLNYRVSVWTRPDAASTDWTMRTAFGSGPGSGPDQFDDPRGLAVSGDGLTAWIADAFNYRVSVWARSDAASLDWFPVTSFGSRGSGMGELSLPSDVTVTGDGLTAVVADSNNDRGSVWTRPGAGSVDWTNVAVVGSRGSGPDQFSDPRGVTVAPDGLTLWVADSGNNRISAWTRPDPGSAAWANQITFGDAPGWAGPLDFPRDVALTANLLTAFVSDSENYRVSVWSRPTTSSAAWVNQTVFGSGPGSALDQLDLARGIAVSPDGRTVWIADAGNDRIPIWTSACP